MTLQSMKCSKCGGKIEMDLTGKEFIFCPFCGEQLAVVNENVKTININKTVKQESVNHTKIAQLEYEKEKEKKDTKIALTILLCMFLIPCIGLLFYYQILPKYNSWQFKKNSVIAAERGLLCAGAAYEYKEKDWKTVRKQFEDMGFTNISHTRIGGIHLIMGGKVDEVSINGRTNFSFGDYFEPDDPVIITHY